MTRARETDFTFREDERLDDLVNDQSDWDLDDRMAAFQGDDFDTGSSELDHKMDFLRALEKEEILTTSYRLDEENDHVGDDAALDGECAVHALPEKSLGIGVLAVYCQGATVPYGEMPPTIAVSLCLNENVDIR